MNTTLNEKFVAYLTLLSGLTLSGVAVYYSVSGLTAIFAAAVIPIIIMGVTLEVSKIVATVWLKQNWTIAPLSIKIYLCAAIALLMIITSMGIFGFLSKAHSDQNLVSGDVQSRIAIYDEKIKTARENIEADRKQLKQMDEAVDQIMGRSTDEKGANKANSVRKSQQRDRQGLAQDIEANQKTIAQLNDEAAPIRAEIRKVDAEVGPIKYIAAFVYGATDQTILEKAVTWVIITIIVVFDPLALILLLASQVSFQLFRKRESKDSGLGVILDNSGTIVGLVVEPKETTAEGDNPIVDIVSPEPTITTSTATTAIVDYAFIDEDFYPDYPTGAVMPTIGSISDQWPCTKCGSDMVLVAGLGRHCLNPQCGVIPVYTHDQSAARAQEVEQLMEDHKEDNRSVMQKLYDAEMSKHDIERGYVQNEEQSESSVWSSVNTISQTDYIEESQIRLENHINEVVELIKLNQITIDDVPQYIQKEVRDKL
jgi:hypothetical protein